MAMRETRYSSAISTFEEWLKRKAAREWNLGRLSLNGTHFGQPALIAERDSPKLKSKHLSEKIFSRAIAIICGVTLPKVRPSNDRRIFSARSPFSMFLFSAFKS
jgi:hypothetical protein